MRFARFSAMAQPVSVIAPRAAAGHVDVTDLAGGCALISGKLFGGSSRADFLTERIPDPEWNDPAGSRN